MKYRILLIITLAVVVIMGAQPAAAQTQFYYWMTAPQFSNANNWQSDPSFWQTIQFTNVDGKGGADACGRGYYGIMCATSTGGTNQYSFKAATNWSPEFANAGGWQNDPSAWSTIRFPDIDGDKKADVCGRNEGGIFCAISDGTKFKGGSLWTTEFSNYQHWNNNPSNWQTIQFPDLNKDGKADVCGRRIDGIICMLSDGLHFGTTYVSPDFRDENGWQNDPSAWATIRFPDIDGDRNADICGRGEQGIYCARFNPARQTFDPGDYLTNQFSNAYGWHTDPSYWQTIQFADIDGDKKDDVCGRGTSGLYCGVSNAQPGVANPHFNFANVVRVPAFNNNPWNAAQYYKTIRLVDVNNDRKADACGRGIDGIVCANAQGQGNAFGSIYQLFPAFGDGAGWNQAEYYWGTVQPAKITTDTRMNWCGRGAGGVECVYFYSQF
jgi:hypothetical protein